MDLDVQRYPLWGGIFYEGETSAGELRRNFPTGSVFQDYGAFRVDTFHQLTYPNTYFGWLSVVPRVGFRETYYGETRDLGQTIFPTSTDPLAAEFPLPNPRITPTGPADTLVPGERKISLDFQCRAWRPRSRSRRHGSECNRARSGSTACANRSAVRGFLLCLGSVGRSAEHPAVRSCTKPRPSSPIDFPQYTSIDSLDNWTIARIGVRNRLQTRRDDLTVSWLELETFFDVNIDNPFDPTQFSNVFNNLTLYARALGDARNRLAVAAPRQAASPRSTAACVSKSPPTPQITVGHRYLNNNPFFLDSSLITLGGYYRINDNWGVGALEQYEYTTKILEQQRYEVYRDLSSWVASLGAIVRDNGGVKEYGVLLTFTLKAFPKFNFDLNFDPGGTNQTSTP